MRRGGYGHRRRLVSRRAEAHARFGNRGPGAHYGRGVGQFPSTALKTARSPISCTFTEGPSTGPRSTWPISRYRWGRIAHSEDVARTRTPARKPAQPEPTLLARGPCLGLCPAARREKPSGVTFGGPMGITRPRRDEPRRLAPTILRHRQLASFRSTRAMFAASDDRPGASCPRH